MNKIFLYTALAVSIGVGLVSGAVFAVRYEKGIARVEQNSGEQVRQEVAAARERVPTPSLSNEEAVEGCSQDVQANIHGTRVVLSDRETNEAIITHDIASFVEVPEGEYVTVTVADRYECLALVTFAVSGRGGSSYYPTYDGSIMMNVQTQKVLWIMGGSDDRRVTQFSPSGTQVAGTFFVPGENVWKVGVYDAVRGITIYEYILDSRWDEIGGVMWSPQGDRIAYPVAEKWTAQQTGIQIINIRTGEKVLSGLSSGVLTITEWTGGEPSIFVQ